MSATTSPAVRSASVTLGCLNGDFIATETVDQGGVEVLSVQLWTTVGTEPDEPNLIGSVRLDWPTCDELVDVILSYLPAVDENTATFIHARRLCLLLAPRVRRALAVELLATCGPDVDPYAVGASIIPMAERPTATYAEAMDERYGPIREARQLALARHAYPPRPVLYDMNGGIIPPTCTITRSGFRCTLPAGHPLAHVDAEFGAWYEWPTALGGDDADGYVMVGRPDTPYPALARYHGRCGEWFTHEARSVQCERDPGHGSAPHGDHGHLASTMQLRMGRTPWLIESVYARGADMPPRGDYRRKPPSITPQPLPVIPRLMPGTRIEHRGSADVPGWGETVRQLAVRNLRHEGYGEEITDPTIARHGPDEVCDCPNPNPGRPFHCMAYIDRDKCPICKAGVIVKGVYPLACPQCHQDTGTDRNPEVAAALAALPFEPAWTDSGELAADVVTQPAPGVQCSMADGHPGQPCQLVEGACITPLYGAEGIDG